VFDIKAAFDLHDADQSGNLQGSELVTVANELGLFLSEKEAGVVLKQIDLDGNGDINFEEFLSFCGIFEKKQAENSSLKTKHKQVVPKGAFSFDVIWD
jgi:Ca2+-binding EF-hand superfamily protein